METNVASMKKSSILAFSAILVFSMVAAAKSLSLVSANGIIPPPINHIYIRSNGTVAPSTAPLLENGDIYTLTESLRDYCVVVERDNIVLDGKGHTIRWYDYFRSYSAITISKRTNVTIKNINIKNFLNGVNLDHASNNTIIENKMSVFKGVALEKADYNRIIGNTVTDGYGVSGEGSNNFIISNRFSNALSADSTGMGINLWDSNNNTISHNTITHELSISLARSQYNTFSNNTIIGGRDGILLGVSSNNLIFGNTIEGKTDHKSEGLYISYDSFGNTVIANHFENNNLAVTLGRSPIGTTVYNNVYDNTFHHNNFVNNVQNVWIASGAPVNFWDDGEEGNYWSDYNGTDADGDGVGDITYNIDGNNTDNHPLMKPVSLRTTDPNLPILSIISPEETTYATNNVALNIDVDKPASWLAYSLDGHTYVTISGNVTLAGLSEGAHSLTLYLSYSGKLDSSSVTFTVDTTAPFVSILHPRNKSYLLNETLLDVALNFTVNEPVSQLVYSLDEQANVTVAGNTTLACLPAGIHNVTVYAWDKVGNVGVSETIIFTIAEPEPELSSTEPSPTMLVIASTGVVSIVGVGLLVYFKKHRRDEVP